MSCSKPEMGERLIELLGPRPAAAPEVEEHLAECLSCAAELAALREGHELLGALKPAPPSEAVLERARVARHSARARTWTRWAAAAVTGLGIAALFVAARGVRGDLWGHALGPVALGVLGLAYALGLRAAARSKPLDPAFLAVTAAGLGLSLALPAGETPAVHHCFALIVGLTLVPLGVALSALPQSPRAMAAGAVAGAATSLVAFAALRAHCPASSVEHFAVAHLTAIPVAALLGALTARLLARPRSA